MSIVCFIIACVLLAVCIAFAISAMNWTRDMDRALLTTRKLPNFIGAEMMWLATEYEDNATQCRALSIITGALAVAVASIGWWLL